MFRALARHAPAVEPGLQTVAAVAGLLQELRSGHAVLLDCAAGEREQLVAALRNVAAEARRHNLRVADGDILARRRLQWAIGIIDAGGSPPTSAARDGFSRLDVAPRPS